MGWNVEVLMVSIKYRSETLGGAERKFMDSYLGKWVHGLADVLHVHLLGLPLDRHQVGNSDQVDGIPWGRRHAFSICYIVYSI